MTREAQKDYEKVKSSHLSKKAKELLVILSENPFQFPPPFEQLLGDLYGYYSRKLNRQHRIVYAVRGNFVVIKSMWTHYENIN